MRRLLRRPPMAAAVLALICAACCLWLPGPAVVRVPFALPLLLILPGFAIVHALFPRGPTDPLRVITYSVGLSIVVGVVGGVEMGARGLLSASSWAALLAGATAAAAGVAVTRSPAGYSAAPRRAMRPAASVRRRLAAALGFVAAMLVIGGAIGLARTPLPVPDDRGYTVLSIGPDAGNANVAAVRVESSESRTRRFRLQIDVPGRPHEFRNVTIVPGEVVVERIALGTPGTGVLSVLLLDGSSGTATVYRRVRVELPFLGPPLIPSGVGAR